MKRVKWANALRGVAAVIVLVAHFLGVFWTRNPDAAGLAHHEALPSSATDFWLANFLDRVPVDFGALGVGFFFLLSGYVIAISLDRYTRRGFLVGRCMRVLPTYAAGFAVTCLVAWIAGAHVTIGRYLIGAIPGLPIVTKRPSVGDGIVWTLIIEIIFYAVCLIAFRRLTTSWRTVGLVGLLCALVQFALQSAEVLATPSPMSGVYYLVLLACPYIPIMLIGVVLSAVDRRTMSRHALLLVPSLSALFLFLAATSDVLVTPLKYRFTYTLATAVFVAVWHFASEWKSVAALDFLAEISYPLYVVHGVLGYVVMFWFLDRDLAGLAAPAALAASVAVAILIHHAVEVPTHRIGQRWARRPEPMLVTV